MAEQKIIDRDTYRAIKKMSYEKLQAFLMCYANELLKNDGKSIDLRQIKGIGNKCIEKITAVIKKNLGICEFDIIQFITLPLTKEVYTWLTRKRMEIIPEMTRFVIIWNPMEFIV